jgi:drug/metabolite transporter (DMT)-like permease
MKLLLHVAPLLALNLGSYVLIKLVGQESPAINIAVRFLLLAMLGCCYALMVLMWLWVGRRYQLSYVYPLVGLNYVIAVFVGVLIFAEPFSVQTLCGAMITTFGVALLSTSPHRMEADKATP